MSLVLNIDQMYKEMKKIVEVGNGDEFPDFADLFFFLAQKMLGSAVEFSGRSVDRKHNFFFFWPNMSKYFLDYIHMWHNATVGSPPLVDTHINLYCKFNIY